MSQSIISLKLFSKEKNIFFHGVFCWCSHCSWYSKCQMGKFSLGNSEKWQLGFPSVKAHGSAERRYNIYNSEFEGWKIHSSFIRYYVVWKGLHLSIESLQTNHQSEKNKIRGQRNCSQNIETRLLQCTYSRLATLKVCKR